VNACESIPNFHLYGEPHRSAEDHYLHVERLADRSLPAGWTIRPHSHRELNHVMLIADGGGTMQAEGVVSYFEAPCLIFVPAGVVHGFQWHADSSGWVVTLGNDYRDELTRRDPDIAVLGDAPAVAPVGRDVARGLTAQVRVLVKELGWIAPGHRTAVDAALSAILVEAVRGLVAHSPDHEQSRGRQAELVARFRALVEERFRNREALASYAAELGVSQTTLRVACARVAGRPPIEIINLRAFLEAKRALCYTNQTVAEIGYDLGFGDPAYFTRSFTRHAGLSPRQFRAQHEVVV
jgi:AraC family transcriptional activator of pobA